MIGESMDLPTQAKALGYLSLAWGLGTILGELTFCKELPAMIICSLFSCTQFFDDMLWVLVRAHSSVLAYVWKLGSS